MSSELFNPYDIGSYAQFLHLVFVGRPTFYRAFSIRFIWVSRRSHQRLTRSPASHTPANCVFPLTRLQRLAISGSDGVTKGEYMAQSKENESTHQLRAPQGTFN